MDFRRGVGELVAFLLRRGAAGFRHIDPLHLVVRRLHGRVGADDDFHIQPIFYLVQGLPLFIQQKSGGLHRQLGDDLGGQLFHGLLLDDPQHRQGQGLDPPDGPLAIATGAGYVA